MIPGADIVLGTASAFGGSILGYEGVKDTNETNAAIANARNDFEAEEALKSRTFSAKEAAINRQFSSGEASRAMDFSERMSSTAVQRRMLDMKKAGINPILAGKFEGSSPVGMQGSPVQPATAKANAHGYTAQNKLQGAMNNLGSALMLKKLFYEGEKTKSDAGVSRNKHRMTAPGASFMDDVDNMYNKGKASLNSFGRNLGSSGYDLKKNLDNVMDRVTKNINEKRKKLHININKPREGIAPEGYYSR